MMPQARVLLMGAGLEWLTDDRYSTNGRQGRTEDVQEALLPGAQPGGLCPGLWKASSGRMREVVEVGNRIFLEECCRMAEDVFHY